MKGQLWISAVLYIALGVVIITLILAAGLPLINKMRDRNTILQTKEMLLQVDENIRAVISEGPGSKRYLSPIEIGKGELYIDKEGTSNVTWIVRTNNKMMEPNILFREGYIEFFLQESLVENEYVVNLNLDYYKIANLELSDKTPYGNPFTGTYSLTIERTDQYSPVNIDGKIVQVPIIELTVA